MECARQKEGRKRTTLKPAGSAPPPAAARALARAASRASATAAASLDVLNRQRTLAQHQQKGCTQL